MSRSIIFGTALGLLTCDVVLASHDLNDGTTPQRHPRFAGIPEPEVELAMNGILKYRGDHVCGVAFIAKNIMLTAAQCVFGRVAKYITVEINNVERHVNSVHYHPYFHSIYLENNIAVISTKKQFPLVEEQILKINPTLPKSYQNMTFSAYYDDKIEGDGGSLKSFKGPVQFVPNSKCAETYYKDRKWPEGHLCAANATDRTGERVYARKPGTPIVNRRDLVGIVSLSTSYCGWVMPEVITSIPYFYDWIEKKRANAEYYETPYYQKTPLTEKELELYNSTFRPYRVRYPEDAAFLVLIEYRGSSKRCIGAIVDERVILTTGECADEADTTTVEVVYAPYRRINESRRLEVIGIQIHPNYNRSSIMDPYNVAVMQLAQPLSKSDTVKIKPATRKPLAQDETKIYGYGQNNKMIFLPVKVSPGDECELLLLQREIHSNGKICVQRRLVIGIKDQGSVLVVDEGSGQSYKRRLAGLLTPIRGVDTLDYRNPAVFVNLAEGPAYTWILERLSDYAKNSQKISSTTEYSNYINEREDGGL
ncbi:hypothetical protein QAD02_009751 [Eretmocerus hayati]|uniref:Uncharacterized protein n=1 Tax=Eretmocerus hayati TaxID=131215 RepID=A0ACC2NBH5_9HYME|nr:hypothetical protein QAD02_009751 [Eretmocerus hayati]